MIHVGKQSLGFTILEVMIVLASTGALLTIALTMIGGQISKTNLNQSRRSTLIGFQDIMNQVTTGSYVFSKDIQCTGNPLFISTVAGTGVQGGNKGCIFLGKAIYITSDISSKNATSYSVYNIVGNQCLSSSGACVPTESLAKSNPVLITKTSDVVINQLAKPVTIKSISDTNSPSPANFYCGVGFIATSSNSSGGSQFGLYGIGDKSNSGNPTTCATPTGVLYSSSLIGIDDTRIVSQINVCLYSGTQGVQLEISSSNSSSSSNNNLQGQSLTAKLGAAC